jgi:hypothetical protein
MVGKITMCPESESGLHSWKLIGANHIAKRSPRWSCVTRYRVQCTLCGAVKLSMVKPNEPT